MMIQEYSSHTVEDMYTTLKEKLELRPSELDFIKRTVATYAQPTLASRVENTFRALVTHSEWQTSKNILKNRSLLSMTDLFDDRTSIVFFQQRAECLSEFLLRFFVSQRGGPVENGLDPELFRNDSPEMVHPDELVERASVGNGLTFPLLPRDLLVKQYKKTHSTFEILVANLDARLKSPPFQRLRTWSRFLDSYVQGPPTPLQQEYARSPEYPPNLIDIVDKLLIDAKKKREIERGILSRADDGRYSVRQLSDSLRQFRNSCDLFKKIVSDLGF